MSGHLKLKPEVKAKWLAALRSGEYQQGREALQNKDGFCCLGVLCDLYQKDVGNFHWKDNSCSGNIAFGSEFEEDEVAFPPTPVYEWAFECTSLPYEQVVSLPQEVYGEEGDSAYSLVGCNDELNLDFDKIADVIEEQL